MDTATSRSYTSEQRGSREEIPKTVASPTYPSLAWRWLNLKLFIKLMSQVHNLAWVPSTVMGGKLPIYLEVTASVEFERVIFFSITTHYEFLFLSNFPSPTDGCVEEATGILEAQFRGKWVRNNSRVVFMEYIVMAHSLSWCSYHLSLATVGMASRNLPTISMSIHLFLKQERCRARGGITQECA